MKSTESAIESTNKSLSPSKSPTKPSGALKRLNSLSDKIYQGEYSPRNMLKVTDLSIDAKTALKIIGSIFLFVLGCQLRWNHHPGFAISKLLWLVTLFCYFYLFPPNNVKSFQKQLIIFFGLRLLSSTIICSVFSGVLLTYEFHVESQEQDTLINLFFTMFAALLVQREMSIIRKCLIFQLISNLIIVLGLQSWYKAFDMTIYLRQIALFMGFTTFYQFMSARFTMDRKLMEATVSKNCEDISQELNVIRQKLEEESQATLADPLYTSKVDELVMKIKYLKFSLLQKEKERTFLKGKQVFTNARRKTYITPSPGPYSPYFEKRSDDTLFPSTPRSEIKSIAPTNTGNTRNELALRWGISARDCDSLVKLILEKQVVMWYPEVVKRQDSPACKETAEFLKQHFTEVGNSLLSTNLSDKPKQPALLASKSFDCSPWSSYLEANICTWNFDMLKFKELTNSNHMIEFGSALMKKFDILKTLNTTPCVVTNFLRDVSDAYLPNPYHNSIHGADVANALGYFLVHNEFGGHFNELEKSCLLVSGLVHDLGHPGLNNAFLVATRSTEALIYNDQSVLENFHAASFFKILQKGSCNIIENLSEKDGKYFRKLSISVILDTDLNKHFVILSKFKNNADSLNLAEENDRFLSLSIALKCADVSHGAKELNLHKRWSRRITEEFFQQGDKEKENNIPITLLCDRTGNISRSQHGFLTFIVLPLFEVLDQRFFNEEMKRTVTDQIRTNINYWNEEIPKEDEGEKNFVNETKKILEDIAEEAASGK